MAIKVPAGRCVECYEPTGSPKKKRCPEHLKGNKYRAQRTVSGGAHFDSRKEARRHADLCVLQQAGKIKDLKLQVHFPLAVNGQRVATYIADFVYTEVATGRLVVEDAKGYRNPYYRMKARLFRAVMGYPIQEV